MNRVLVVDDNADIHEDFKNVLNPIDTESPKLKELSSELFPENFSEENKTPNFDLAFSFTGEIAVKMVSEGLKNNKPYSLVFVDMRMPPGIDGLETAEKLMEIDENIQIVICTAYSDHSWTGISSRLSSTDNFLILKKPFEAIEILQMASSLCEKFRLKKSVEEQMQKLINSNEIIRSQKIKAESADKAKSTMLSNVSHELKTPLNILLGVNEVLGSSELSDQQKQLLTLSNKSGHQLLTLISNLLDLSKFEAGKEILDNKNFSSKEFFNNLFQTFVFRADQVSVKFSTDVAEELNEYLYSDDKKLNIIFSNLIDNALKFSHDASVDVNVSKEKHQSSDMINLVYKISDTGIGIDPVYLENIFGSFTQEDSSNSKEYPGVGLGLNIVKRYVDLLKGEINVSSSKGVGTSFEVALPIKIGKKVIKVKESKTEDDVEKNIENFKILLVEDNEDNVELMKIFLTKVKCEMSIAFNGIEAVELFKKDKYDIVLMDIMMPKMNGYDATLKIREYEKSMGVKRTPVYALTAFSKESDLTECIEAGCDEILTKPIKREMLLSKLQELQN